MPRCSDSPTSGFWDPWELGSADKARQLVAGNLPSSEPRTLALRLVALGFSSFGVREWAGRAPIALAGLALLLACGLCVRRLAGTRSALYAVVILGTTPYFLLHSRLLLGGSPGFLAAALVFWGAAAAVFPAAREGVSDEQPWAPYAWLTLALLGAVLGAFSTGVMLTVLPALGAVALVSLLRGPVDDSVARQRARWLVIAAASFVSIAVVRAVLRREAEYSLWLGGAPNDGSVPSYDRVVEQLFHSFAPWSALLPVALGALLRLDARADQPLRLLCIAWASLAYAAQTLFMSSYGSTPFPAPAALAIAAALWLSDRDDRTRSFWPEAVIALLLVGLIIRDFALYPASPLGGLVLGDTKLPPAFNPKRAWSALLGAFALALALSSMASERSSALDLRAPYRGAVRLFRQSRGHKAWLILAALLLLGLLLFGVLSFVPSVPLTSLARRIGKVAGVLPLALPLGVALGQLVFHYSSRLAALRHVPMFAVALGLAMYTSVSFVPELSAQFSPAKLFDAYNRLAAPGEPLVQHQVESGAAHYYAKGDIREIKTRPELIDYLSAGSERRWAAIPSDQLADIDVAFRRKTHRHLFVPSAENARVTLVVSQPIKGQHDLNPIARFVRTSEPTVQHPVHARFEDKIELVGYTLDLGGKDYVGAGQVAHVTWFWRALQGNLGTYKIFLHVDAPNQRINGDHEPVDGKYPVRLWDEGDVIVDRQDIPVPATSRPGRYTLNIGFFRGETRLKVVEGPQDGQDRLRAGEFEVR
ncbi:MAG: hypothetical protein QM778_02980 [Myxococcales bacterium]